MIVDPPTFGQLSDILAYACQNHGVNRSDREAVERLAVKILLALGYYRGDAESNARTLALMVYRVEA